MVEIKDLITNDMLQKAISKGLSEKEIKDAITRIITNIPDMEEKEKILFLRNRINAWLIRFINSNKVYAKAIVIGMRKYADMNDIMRKSAKNQVGKEISKFKSKGMYTIIEDHFASGRDQGKPIPLEKNLIQNGLTVIEYKNKMYVKSCIFQGDWVEDININNAKSGDVISITIPEESITNPNKSVYINKYEIITSLPENKYEEIINTQLNDLKTNLLNLNAGGFEGNKLVVLNCNAGGFEGKSVLLTDYSEDGFINPDASISAYLDEINFIEGALRLTILGEAYINKEGTVSLNIYKIIVPEKYKKINISKESQKAVEDDFSDLTSQIDDDLGDVNL